MKFFGWKSAGREASRPVLSRGFSTWTGANTQGEWPRGYEPQVRDGFVGNPVAQRAVRLVSEGVGSAPVTASDPAALALVAAKSGGQSLIETMAMHLLLHGNAYVQVLRGDDDAPRELFALRPERVTVEADARGWPAAFIYKAGTAVTRLSAEDARGALAVIHVKTVHPLDDHYGLGCLGAAAGAIAIHNAATRWNKALLDNAARPSGALVYEPGEPGAVLAAVGGPIGGAIGAIAGQAIDQAIFAPAARQGPRLADLTVQTSTYGAAIPQIFGRTRVAGTVIWSTDLIETRKTQGGGKGRASTETYSYNASFAVALLARSIVRVERIWADGKLLRGSAGDLKVELGAIRLHPGDADQRVDPLIASAEGVNAPAYRGLAYAVFEGLQLGEYGNRIPSLSFEVVADDADVTVGNMLADLAAPDVVADAGPMLSGFAATGTNVRAVAETLGAAFPIICRDEDGAQLRFALTPAGTLAGDDLGAGNGTTAKSRTAFDIDPLDTTQVSLTMAYLDATRDYQPGLQRARREGPGQRAGRIDLPAVIEASQARGIVERVLARSATARTRARVSLPWRAMMLRPGDAVRVADTDWQISGTRFERMAIELDLVRTGDVGIVTTADPGRSLAQLDAPQGATILEVIDLPPLSDVAVTRPAVAVLASGASAGWRRAALLSSIDGGATFEPAGTTALPAVMGATATVLPVGPSALIDRISTVEVELAGEWMTLGDADEVALLAGANLAIIGDELIQFGRATALSPTRWRLGELWRGRRGTEDMIAAHPFGSRFVRIEAESMALLAPDRAITGVRIMAAGIGDTEPYPLATTATATRAALPLSPAHLSARLLPSGDTELRWTRRSREGWAWRDTVEVPLSEEREAYRVARTAGLVSAVVETGEPLFLYTSAMRAADTMSGALSVSFSVLQVGATGVSPSAALTLSLV